MYFGYFAGNVFIMIRYTVEITLCDSFPIFFNGLFDVFIETLVVHKIKFLCHDFTKLRDFLNNPNVSVSILGKEE